MFVSQVHRVVLVDLGVDQLLAQIGRGVDHDPGGALIRGALDQQEQRRRRFLGWVGSRPPQPSAGPASRPRIRSRGSSVSASCGRLRRGPFETGGRSFGRLPRKFFQRHPARSAPHLCDFHDVGRLVAFAAELAGARYGESVSTMMRRPQFSRECAQRLRFLEGQDARERDRKPSEMASSPALCPPVSNAARP